mmetsp:Transcript_15772/g.66455  ORF Transcript_15772/g.66455 Transcript_15772/m.66455 type:complete len:262 (+) Transcript_15772:370-1155(+)
MAHARWTRTHPLPLAFPGKLSRVRFPRAATKTAFVAVAQNHNAHACSNASNAFEPPATNHAFASGEKTENASSCATDGKSCLWKCSPFRWIAKTYPNVMVSETANKTKPATRCASLTRRDAFAFPFGKKNAPSWNGASALHAALGKTCVTHARRPPFFSSTAYLVMSVFGTIRPAVVRNEASVSRALVRAANGEHDPGRNATQKSIAHEKKVATRASQTRRAPFARRVLCTSLASRFFANEGEGISPSSRSSEGLRSLGPA